MNIRFRQIIKAERMDFDERPWRKKKNNIAKRCLWRVRLYILEQRRAELIKKRKNKGYVSKSDIVQRKIEALWGGSAN